MEWWSWLLVEYWLNTWALLMTVSSLLLYPPAQGEITLTIEPYQGTHIRAGQNAEFSCRPITDYGKESKLIIRWKKDSEDIHSDQRYRIDYGTNSLTIVNSTVKDTGDITCLTDVSKKELKATATLVVQDVPDPPVNVKLLMSCQSRYARISWQFFNENNAQVQNFIIQYNTSFDPNIWVTAKESEHKTKYYETIELSPWGNYSFRVIARNEVGEGMPSVPTQGECQVPPDVPEHNPDNVCTANDTPHTLTITWQRMPVTDHNAPGFHYNVSWRRYEDPKIKTFSQKVTADQDRLVINKQPVYKPYEIQVQAFNSIGKAAREPHTVIGYSGEDVPLDAPSRFSLDKKSSVSNTTAHFVWKPVDTSVSRVRGFFRGYQIEFWKTENPSDIKIHLIILDKVDLCKGIQKADRLHRKVGRGQVNDLWPCSNITAQIRVINTKYTGPASNTVSFKTEEGVPESVQNLRITSTGSTHFVLRWQKPKVTYGQMTGYTVSYKAKNRSVDEWLTSEKTQFIANLEHSTTKLMGLRPQHLYRISVCANTKRGCGDPHVVEADTLPDTAPGVPDFTAVNMNETWLNVTWLPARSGDPGCKFSASYRQLDRFIWRNTSNILSRKWVIIKNLMRGSVYEVRCIAKNCGTGKYFHETPSAIKQVQIGQPSDFVVPEFEVFKIDDTTLGVSLVRTNKFANVFYVQYKEAGSVEWSATDDSMKDKRILIHGLKSGRMYAIQGITRTDTHHQTRGTITYTVLGEQNTSEWKGSKSSAVCQAVTTSELSLFMLISALIWPSNH